MFSAGSPRSRWFGLEPDLDCVDLELRLQPDLTLGLELGLLFWLGLGLGYNWVWTWSRKMDCATVGDCVEAGGAGGWWRREDGDSGDGPGLRSTLTSSSSDDVMSASASRAARDVISSSSVTSSDWTRLCFVLLFWNQTFTCATWRDVVVYVNVDKTLPVTSHNKQGVALTGRNITYWYTSICIAHRRNYL